MGRKKASTYAKEYFKSLPKGAHVLYTILCAKIGVAPRPLDGAPDWLYEMARDRGVVIVWDLKRGGGGYTASVEDIIGIKKDKKKGKVKK